MSNESFEVRLAGIEKRLDILIGSQSLSYSGFQVDAAGDFSVMHLLTAIWQRKLVIAIVTILFAVASVVIAITLPNVYRAEVSLVPAGDEGKTGLGAMAGRIGGLAALAGVSLGDGGADRTTVSLEILTSKDFIGKFIDRHNLLVPLMAAKTWDKTQNVLLIDDDIYDQKTNAWVRSDQDKTDTKPSRLEAHKEFTRILSVSRDKKTDVIKIGIKNYSPYVAKEWVDWLIADLNEEMRRREIAEATQSIKYLEQQVRLTEVSDVRAVLFQVIEEQTKRLMFAEVSSEYAFKTIDPAFVPEEKAEPRRALICVFGTFLGAALASMIVLLMSFRQRLRQSTSS